MEKKTKVVLALVIIAVLVVIAIVVFTKGGSTDNTTTTPTNLSIRSEEDLYNLLDEIYEGQSDLLTCLTTTIDLKDADVVKSYTGLENGDNLDYAIVSEPARNAQAFSLVLAKVKIGASADKIAETMSEQVNNAKWICVAADELYATSSGDVVCFVMANENRAKPIYDKFKTLAGTVGKEYTKTFTEDFDPDFPPVEVVTQ